MAKRRRRRRRRRASCETPRVLVFTPRVCAALHRRLEKGVDHLTNAIAVCGQPQQLLQVLQQTLPPPVFQMLLTKLPSISQRIVSARVWFRLNSPSLLPQTHDSTRCRFIRR
ncbi:mitochondrial import receptor subunit TOM20 homolog [Pseudoliparis swirei]|uniref:mitochondrial import receptor subunit TOM20 homolog n=1 Tax=Pseudoliparis swirei TaxID=2059687 RepID=UPI0024BD6774|nr:mitochondrial import receptor subunit TOM20 homolog [Pseudoliparis swirei]